MSDTDIRRSCVDCGVANCIWQQDTFPPFCLSTSMDEELLADAMAEYKNDEVRKIAVSAAEVEAENYLKMTRMEETIEFAKKIGAKKIGIATCAGLLFESRTVAKILRARGFEVVGIACKCATQSKQDIGIPERCNAVGPTICNPVLQAKFLNKEKTDLNILVGLCVGHDSLFYKFCDGLVTTLVAKDRVLGHNTVAAIYQADKYYKTKLYL